MPDVRAACHRLQATLASAGDRYPSIPYVGLALWLAWQRLMWGTCSNVAAGSSAGFPPGLLMHVAVNGALVACVFCCAALEGRGTRLPRKSLVGWGSVAAAVGSAGALASLAWTPVVPLFVASCLLAGFGMGILLVHAMALFGRVSPGRLLLLTGMAWGVAAAVNIIVGAFAPPVACVVFCLLPLLALACFATSPGTYTALSPAAAPAFQVPVPRPFWPFACTVFAVSLVAQSVIYFNGEHYNAFDRHAAATAVDGVIIVVALILAAYAVLCPRSHNYGALYYPTVFVVMGLLTLLFVAPARTVAPLVASRVVFQVFGLILWCLLHYVAAQSGSSPVKVYGYGYGLHMLGSIMGYGVGSLLSGAHPWSDSQMLFVYLGAAILVLALSIAIYPPRTMRDLLSSIPLDDAAESPAPQKPDAWLTACNTTAAAGGLTDREREVMLFLARGRGSAHIAQSLNVSLSTTYTHTRNIYRKLDVHSREELMALVDTHLED